MKLPTYEEILPYIEQKLVSEQSHPEDPDVRIFNYTQKCQFSREWNDITRQCRGLIFNVKTGEVIARPFPKFFNYQEHVQNAWPIPGDEPTVFEKLDGSLGILYFLNGNPWIATRGSFMSDQARWATEWYRKNVGFDPIEPNITNLFEIIYPENRIVVNYDFSGLVYLGSILNWSGETAMDVVWNGTPIRTAKKIPTTNIEELMDLDEPNSEGFVIFYPKENVRMKIKFNEYVRLHKIVTGISEIGIWEHMKDGKSVEDLLEKVPDEFFRWVKEVQNRLMNAYQDVYQRARQDFNEILNGETQEQVAQRASWRKDFAIKAAKTKYPGVVFAILDDKPYEQMIWKMVRPSGSKVFKTDIDL